MINETINKHLTEGRTNNFDTQCEQCDKKIKAKQAKHSTLIQSDKRVFFCSKQCKEKF